MTAMHCDLPPLHLEDDAVSYACGRIGRADLPDPQPRHPARLVGATPLLERLWRVALADAEANVVQHAGNAYFGSGRHFGPILFTRDIAYSGVLGLNPLFPALMRSSLMTVVGQRLSLGWRAPRAYHIPELDAPWVLEEGSDGEFLERHRTNCFVRRTDDVVWLWAAGELAEAGALDWAWVHATGTRCFDELYAPLLDPSDGLWRGQASFIDIHFEHKRSAGYPLDWSIADCVLIKATSTNCLYVRGMQVMAQAAAQLSRCEEAESWRARGACLAATIRQRLRRPDGACEWYLDRHGRPSGRTEALGTALAVLLGVLSGAEAVAAIAAHPFDPGRGVPVFWPFFDDARCYHNLTAWPFVESFFMRARERATGEPTVALELALLARSCVDDGTFHEVVDWRSGKPGWSASQLWTAAAFLGACRRAGLAVNAGCEHAPDMLFRSPTACPKTEPC